MALIRRAAGSGTTITVLTFGLMANLAPMATFAAVMPEITADWGLTASQAGWIGGIYFGGYAACVPILAGATDKIDARWVFVGCSLLGAVANFIFAGIADGFWMALVLRFLSGAGLAGVHMPGLKLLADRVTGRAGARGAAIYTSSYALGSAGSFFLTGIVDTAFGWRASFTASGIAPLLAIAALTLLPAASELETGNGCRPGFPSGVARPGVDGVRAGLCRQYLGGVRRPGLVCGISRLDAQPPRQRNCPSPRSR